MDSTTPNTQNPTPNSHPYPADPAIRNAFHSAGAKLATLADLVDDAKGAPEVPPGPVLLSAKEAAALYIFLSSLPPEWAGLPEPGTAVTLDKITATHATDLHTWPELLAWQDAELLTPDDATLVGIIEPDMDFLILDANDRLALAWYANDDFRTNCREINLDQITYWATLSGPYLGVVPEPLNFQVGGMN